MKAKLQQDTVKSIVEQKKKGGKVEFDSSLMTVEEFADCYKAAESRLKAESEPKAEPKPEPKKDK